VRLNVPAGEGEARRPGDRVVVYSMVDSMREPEAAT
jgi:hypothetical protein